MKDINNKICTVYQKVDEKGSNDWNDRNPWTHMKPFCIGQFLGLHSSSEYGIIACVLLPDMSIVEICSESIRIGNYLDEGDIERNDCDNRTLVKLFSKPRMEKYSKLNAEFLRNQGEIPGRSSTDY